MTASEPDWRDVAHLVAVGDRLKARVLRVDRWGLLVDVDLPFNGFIDRLNIGDDLERFHPGLELDVVVVQLAEYNHQIRLHLAAGTAGSASGSASPGVPGPGSRKLVCAPDGEDGRLGGALVMASPMAQQLRGHQPLARRLAREWRQIVILERVARAAGMTNWYFVTSP
jgi:hypothetical protein